METSLGQRQADGSSGDDTYLGGDQTDRRLVSSGVRRGPQGDPPRRRRGRALRRLALPGYGGGELGVGADKYWTERSRAGVDVDGEEGRDRFVAKCVGCRLLEARLETRCDQGRRRAGRHGGRLRGRRAGAYDGRAIRIAVVVGTRGPNRITVLACQAVAARPWRQRHDRRRRARARRLPAHHRQRSRSSRVTTPDRPRRKRLPQGWRRRRRGRWSARATTSAAPRPGPTASGDQLSSAGSRVRLIELMQ